YYKAHTPEKIETLADYVDNPESKDFQVDFLRQQVTLKECGVKDWENIEVLVLPMSDGKHWLAAVSCELIIEGIDVGIPGMKVELVCRNEKGELKIASYDDSEYSDAFIQELRELSLSDEIVERNNQIAMLYNDLIAERSDIMEWALEASQAIDREVGEALAEKEALTAKADSEEEKPTAKKGSYTVKKGDCLWDIAEEQLGDGMLWSGLYEQNKDVVGDDPDLLYVGITLQLN
ncbi:MAG: LysM peptidoglycan-binding domain-containing protein, partial [Lachnospiraceae bacterium]|nr:LysM peptidoglycan-binding domain-containing protein [Lachnospiraceae bacterium]